MTGFAFGWATLAVAVASTAAAANARTKADDTMVVESFDFKQPTGFL
jgi:hypothetical protein